MSVDVRHIAVLGTGIMGAPMARRLHQAGFHVSVWNRTRGKTAPLEAEGIIVADNAPLAVAQADSVIVMLSSGPVCEAVLTGVTEEGTETGGGVIAAMQPRSTLVIMSSIPVETVDKIGKIAAKHEVLLVDAPVSGGEKGAKEGTLSIMAGGDEAVVQHLEPVFSPLGRLTHVGGLGSGTLAKLANQIIVAATICAVAEALTLAERGGANPTKVREALLGGFADSTILHQHGLRMVEGDFHPGGPAKHQLKDTTTAINLARKLGVKLPVSAAADALFQAMVDHGDGDMDHSGVIRELQRMNT